MIPFVDFKVQYHDLKDEIDEAVHRVLDSGWYILGNEVKVFEQELASYIGTKYCVGVASGTEAIALSLLAVGVKPGDEVITTDMTAYPTVTGIVQANAVPVLVDIFYEDGLIDSSKIEQYITPNTKAIVPVHLYGQSCDMDALRRIAQDRGISIVEDCAQAAGASYKGSKVGSMGTCGAFSFYPTKNLGAYGDGGAITTNDEKLYETLISMRNYGQTSRYTHDSFGINSRLDEIQAAILRVKLLHLDADNQKRRAIAHAYQSNLHKVVPLVERPYGDSVYHLFVVKTGSRDAFMKFMEDRGIKTLIHFPIPNHAQKAFVWKIGDDYQQASRFAEEIVSIPIYPELTDSQVDEIISVINTFGD
ncbi:MAG TPA: erythromycin biosynthesis sensory transduction protein eryC1 [Candidatus Magasanikbacteria bacterium]|nr:erythromycin biosynthesis sensory transduction protein eryC1 [Candidatus Magasanikbacteria bacterium]